MTAQDGQTRRRANPRTMRLPGSVAEIKGSPAGPRVGAFFDLDGTLVAGFTGVIMTRDRLRRGQMGVGEFIGMVQAGLNHQLGRSEFEDLIGKGARMLRGSSLGDIDELAERLFVQKIIGRIYPEMRDLVRAHMERGHTVVLSSSALTVQVEPVARFLGIKNVLSNKFETDDDGLITGKVTTPIIWGPGKARAVQIFAAENNVDLSKSYFYADGDEDVALMYLVGNPRPTNPAGKLAAVAAKRGWPVLRFSSRSGSNPVSQLRTAAGVASMVPIASAARRARPAHPQPSHRRQLLHVGIRAGAADHHRGEHQPARQGEPDQASGLRCSSSTTATRSIPSSRAGLSKPTSRPSARRNWRTIPSSARWAR